MDYSEFTDEDLLSAYEEIDLKIKTESHQMFIDYNIVDVELVDELEAKLKLIELAISIAYMAKINFDDVYSPVKMWDTIIYNHLLDKGTVVPFKSAGKGSKIEGAFVKEVIKGRYGWLASFDLASLYPHIMMALNMSPETVQDTMVDVTVAELLAGDRSKVKPGFSLAPNGSMYDMSEVGFLAELMSKYYNGRKTVKNEMLALKKQLEANRESMSPEEIRLMENKIVAKHNLQLALKIAINSAYGACAQESFRFYDTRIAEGITMSGQLIIQNAMRTGNQFLNKLLENEKEKDYVLMADTDSVVGSTVIEVNGEKITIADYFERCVGDFIKCDDFNEDYVKKVFGDTSPSVSSELKLEHKPIKYVMKHKVKKRLFKIKCGDKEVVVTEDHSIMVMRDGKLIKVKPHEVMADTDSLVISK